MPPSKNRRRFPDEAHEDLAVWVEETIAEQATTGADVGDSLLLADTLFTLIDQATAGTADLTTRVITLEQQVADLAARLAVLEPAVFSAPPASDGHRSGLVNPPHP